MQVMFSQSLTRISLTTFVMLQVIFAVAKPLLTYRFTDIRLCQKILPGIFQQSIILLSQEKTLSFIQYER